MIALIADFSHRFAMNRWVRGWLSFHPVFRLIFVWIIAVLMIPVVIASLGFLSLTIGMITGGLSAGIADAAGLEDLADAILAPIRAFTSVCCCGSLFAPQFLFGLPLGIFVFEVVYTRSRIRRLVGQYRGVLGTKAHYLGSQPQQPHSRFVYLVLAGTRTKPDVIMVVGRDVFTLPVLEIVGDRPAARAELPPEVYVHWLFSFLGAQANLVIRYAGEAGRVYSVEFSNFWGGAVEAQKWVNFVVSSRYQAETGEEPYRPWKSLPPNGGEE
jgi:hypothetical protein